MDSHRVEIFDGTDDDTVVLTVTDDLHLILFPAKQRLLYEDFRYRRGLQTVLDDLFELVHVICDTGTATRKSIGGTDDQWETNILCRIKGFIHIVGIL